MAFSFFNSIFYCTIYKITMKINSFLIQNLITKGEKILIIFSKLFRKIFSFSNKKYYLIILYFVIVCIVIIIPSNITNIPNI